MTKPQDWAGRGLEQGRMGGLKEEPHRSRVDAVLTEAFPLAGKEGRQILERSP